jgi:hypothetical protein
MYPRPIKSPDNEEIRVYIKQKPIYRFCKARKGKEYLWRRVVEDGGGVCATWSGRKKRIQTDSP